MNSTRAPSWTLLLFGGLGGAPSVNEIKEISERIADAFDRKITSYIVIADKTVPSDNPITGHWLLDPLRFAHERDGVTHPAFYLLRPDTYVGARGPIGEATRLITHLKAIFAHQATF